MNGKRWAAVGIAAGIFFISIMLNVAYSIAFGNFSDAQDSLLSLDSPEFVEKRIESGTSMNRIAVLEVNGVIQDVAGANSIFQMPGYNHRQFLGMLDEAKNNDLVKGIILRINSPGGGVVESAEIHDKIVKIREETEKPVFVAMESVAASGGYYIAAPADKIFAHPATITGSLGVIMETIDYSELVDQLGIQFETVKSGAYKDIGTPNREMTDEEREILQTMVNNSYEQFVDVIANGRKMSEAEVKQIADGRIYDGLQAKDLNLIDELGSIDDVIQAMKEEIGDENANIIKYELGFRLGSFFQLSAQKLFGNDYDILGIKQLIRESNSPRIMYLYTK